MTTEMKNKLRAELNRAYAHFGVEEEELENKVEEAMFAANMNGKFVCIAVSEPADFAEVERNGKRYNKNRIKSIDLVIGESELHYELRSYDSYVEVGHDAYDGMEVDNETTEVVVLANISDEFVVL